MKHLLYISIGIIILFFTACDENVPINTDDPTNLELSVLVYDDYSGIVVIQATADNATEYHFYTGDDTPQPIIQSSGYYEHNYLVSGSYTIEVRAFGKSGRYLKATKRISVSAQDPVNVGEGYTTPLQYDGMTLVWNDEFDGDALNSADWSYDNGNGCPNLCGWGNNELEYYIPDNSKVEGGLFTIEAREEVYSTNNYTSTKIVTRNKQIFQYGRVDIRAQLPKGQGLWPALWMLGDNQPQVGWPACGEIDIMEMVGGNGRENTVGGNAYWDNNGITDNPRLYTLSDGTFYDKFHVFSIIWDENQIRWFVDDIEYHSMSITPADRSEFHRPFYFIFNVAVGGNWPGSPDETTIFPTQMHVDYIRVFQEN